MSSGYSISVITVNLNNGDSLGKTIQSVANQKIPHLEYIVIDGCSNDNSVEVIKKHSSSISYWISERDNGVYQAMNKGILKASKEYILFLNSGDEFLAEDSLQKLIDGSLNEDIIYGDLLVRQNKREWIDSFPSTLTFSYLIDRSLPHPSTLIRRTLFNMVGLYNEELKIVSDWEFFLKAIFKYNASYRHIAKVITIFNFDGISSQKENQGLLSAEIKSVLQKQFSGFLPDYEKLKKIENELNMIHSSRFFKIMRKVKKIGSK